MMRQEIKDMVHGYIDLMSRRSDLFPMADNIVTDPDVMLEYAERNGRPVGLVYESPWHFLLVDVVRQSDGSPGYTYERYVSSSINPGSVAIPVFPDGRICLLKNYRHTLGHEVLELPRGMGFDNEDSLKTASRELAEELGAKAVSAELLGYVVVDSGMTGDRVAVVKVCIEATDVQIGHEGISGYIAPTRSELDELVASGKVEDGFTFAALALLDATVKAS